MVADKKELNGGNFRRSFQIPPIMDVVSKIFFALTLGTFKAGRISHLASRISHVISLYNIYLKDRLEPCVTSNYLR